MVDITALLNGKIFLSKDDVAKLLQTTPGALDAFEKSYRPSLKNVSDNFFEINAKQASAMGKKEECNDPELIRLKENIINELLDQTIGFCYDGKKGCWFKINPYEAFSEKIQTLPITLDDIKQFPEELQPQVTGNLAKKDFDMDSYPAALFLYDMFLKNKGTEQGRIGYQMFRQGLDILDLDPVLYEIIGMNKNSMGNWLPEVVAAIQKQDFFKIPKTKLIKVPLPLLQLTRTEYGTLTQTTKDILNGYCMSAFGVNVDEQYFIKTGTYSSKYDFRNAVVKGAEEVRELGEYLLYIHFQALQMASPLCQPVIYGVSTTNEWVVREYIPDVENNPSIYKGMTLHTEYRIFVDFDDNRILGIAPYWEPKTMKDRFLNRSDSNETHQIHDYIIFQMHENRLMKRFDKNKNMVASQLEKILPDIRLHGQYSVDIMQNGKDFYLIDMALAQNSALNEYIPIKLRRPMEENWLPEIN